MGDYYYGKIEIGGHHSRESFAALLKRLKGGQQDVECSDSGMGDGTVVLTMQDSTAKNGGFLYLEEWLTDNKIPWVRASDGYDMSDIAPECAWWVEGMKSSRSVVTTQDHDPIIDYGTLVRMVEALAGKGTEDLPLVAASSPPGSWEAEFAREGLSSATDLATFLKKKLDESAIPVIPNLSVEGMSAQEIIDTISAVISNK